VRELEAHHRRARVVTRRVRLDLQVAARWCRRAWGARARDDAPGEQERARTWPRARHAADGNTPRIYIGRATRYRAWVVGPDVPAWRALRDALDKLVEATPGGFLAAVVDEVGTLWCWSTPAPPLRDAYATITTLSDPFHANEIATLTTPLRKGGHLSVVRGMAASEAPEPRRVGHLTALRGGATVERSNLWCSYAAESFSSYYVLVVWLEDDAVLGAQQDVLRAALPGVMSLVASLPPSGGPTATARAQRARSR
jgi:hypothetical protein